MIHASGLVGLSPRKFHPDADLFILKMKESGSIDEAVFSMSIAPGWQQSKMTFGGYDDGSFATGPVEWLDIDPYGLHWQLNLDKVESLYFDQKISEKLSSQATKIIVDSGTSFNLMPRKDLETMIKQFEYKLDITCQLKIVPICTCPTYHEFPDLKYRIQGKDYFMPRGSYLLPYDGKCYLKFMHHPTIPVHILGLNFFQNYYTIFDQEEMRVGFAPSIHADTRLKDVISMSKGFKPVNNNIS